MYENRKYVIFDVSELDKIDFTQVLETSAQTVRKSLDGTKTFVKWAGEVPTCVLSLNTKSSILTHEEIVSIMDTEEWTEKIN